MKSGLLRWVVLATLVGCGVDAEDVLHSYIRGYQTLVQDHPCSTVDCVESDLDVAGPISYYSLTELGVDLEGVYLDGDDFQKLVSTYQEAVYDGCSIPKGSKLETIDRVEASVLGAEDACDFFYSFGYARDCSGVEKWARSEVTDNFGGFVHTLKDQASKCSDMAAEISP